MEAGIERGRPMPYDGEGTYAHAEGLTKRGHALACCSPVFHIGEEGQPHVPGTRVL